MSTVQKALKTHIIAAPMSITARTGRCWATAAIGLEEVSEGYRAMDSRESLKVLVRP